MMQSLFSGSLKSYSSQLNVVQEIKRGIPATLSLTIGAGIIWLGFGILVGVISAVTAGRLSDRVITVLALIGISYAVFCLKKKNSAFQSTIPPHRSRTWR